MINEKIFNLIPGLAQSGWSYKDYKNIWYIKLIKIFYSKVQKILLIS